MSSQSAEVELKGLQVRRDKLKAEMKSLLNDKTAIEDEHRAKKAQLKNINIQIENLCNKSKDKDHIIISEHAIIRYLERVDGINISELVDRIRNDLDKSVLEFIGTAQAKVPINSEASVKAVVKGGHIVTFT